MPSGRIKITQTFARWLAFTHPLGHHLFTLEACPNSRCSTKGEVCCCQGFLLFCSCCNGVSRCDDTISAWCGVWCVTGFYPSPDSPWLDSPCCRSRSQRRCGHKTDMLG